MEYHIYWHLDRRSVNTENLHPVKIAVSWKIVDYLPTGEFVAASDFPLLKNPHPPKRLGEIISSIQKKESRIRAILDTMTCYDRRLVRQRLKEPVSIPHLNLKDRLGPNVYNWFEEKITELKALDALGTAESYESTRSFFQRHTGTVYIDFSYFTKTQLYSIQKKALSKVSEDTLYKHMRQLRTIFNMAINEKLISKDIYPFGKRGYLIPQTQKTKKSLRKEDLHTLFSYRPGNASEQEALDYFTFSYFGNGMNIKDVAYLKYENIQGNYLQFYRIKTRNTSTKPTLIRVYITSEMWEIINRQGNQPALQSKFIFPIINEEDSLEKQRTDYRNFNRVINERLDKIATRLSIEAPLTHGVSRHSFANSLKQAGVPTEQIQESLGHSSPATTEHYLSSFEDTIIASHAEKLRKYIGKD